MNVILANYQGKEMVITDKDLWFLNYIKELGFGKLSEVEIQNGVVVMIKKCEKKIKPEVKEYAN